ncbi:MAG: bifunctional 5,10-methylenetetrahydrofolate dehydrogenase/5,10-methenyltetrahydrofolate cyclohydrolase [Patescibacteria group bacterium]|nr:bifunctional 5,10-methylenetetrahydrofolate dehydrogenase/5,10-methenyltetrahydrofolate cyclohydrolase [Patescibacteria group bacterium]
MAKIINGKALAEKIKDNIVKEIINLNGPRPNLAIILIGGREDSKLYVDLKEEEAKKVGIDTHLYKCPGNISEKKVLEMIDHLNKDELIDGILVQLPLPKGFETNAIIKAINPAKDVDGFHPDNLKILFKTCDHHHVMPSIFEVILEILKNIDCQLESKRICVIVNWEIFGKSLSKVLECQGAKVEIVYADDNDLIQKTKRADILITAVGKPGFIKKDMIKKNAVIIDIGITKKGKKVYGDVDFENVKNKVGFITPVPGGVGPMTIAMAFKNTLELYKRNKKIRK